MKWIINIFTVISIVIHIHLVTPYPNKLPVLNLRENQGKWFRDRNDENTAFDSDESIHYHIWNDMNNDYKLYPHVTQQFKNPTRENSLPNETYKKSDRNLYGLFYKLNNSGNGSVKWNYNYYPSVVNYKPKPHRTNIRVYPIKSQAATTVATTTVPYRQSLYEKLQLSKNRIHEYYTNLQSVKSTNRNVDNSKVNETTFEKTTKNYKVVMSPEQRPVGYRTYHLWEPVPGQIMLPPRVPQFKPLRAPVRITPVIEVRPTDRPVQIVQRIPAQTFQHTSTPQVFPFYEHEAVTMSTGFVPITVATVQSYIPVTEEYEQPRTEPFIHHRPVALTPNFSRTKVITSAPTTMTTTTTQPFTTIQPIILSTVKSYPSIVYAVTSNSINETTYNTQYIGNDGSSNNGDYSDEYRGNDVKHNNIIDPQHKNNENDHQIFGYNSDEIFNADKLVSGEKQINPIFQAHNLNADQTNSYSHKFKVIENYMAPKSKNTNKNVHNHQLHQTVKSLNKTGTGNMSGFMIVNSEQRSQGSSQEKHKWVWNEKMGMYENRNDIDGKQVLQPPFESIVYGKHDKNVYVDPPSQPLNQLKTPSPNAHSDSIQLSTTYSKQITNNRNDSKKNTTQSVRNGNKFSINVNNNVNMIIPSLNTSRNMDIRNSSNYYVNNNSSSNDNNKDNGNNNYNQFHFKSPKNNDEKTLSLLMDSDAIAAAADAITTTKTNYTKAYLKKNIRKENNNNNNIYKWNSSSSSNSSNTSDNSNIHNHNYNNVMSIMKYGNANKSNKNENNDKYENHNQTTTITTASNEKYYNWYNNYAADNRKHGRSHIISEHFKKVEIEPNVAWVILPR